MTIPTLSPADNLELVGGVCACATASEAIEADSVAVAVAVVVHVVDIEPVVVEVIVIADSVTYDGFDHETSSESPEQQLSP